MHITNTVLNKKYFLVWKNIVLLEFNEEETKVQCKELWMYFLHESSAVKRLCRTIPFGMFLQNLDVSYFNPWHEGRGH